MRMTFIPWAVLLVIATSAGTQLRAAESPAGRRERSATAARGSLNQRFDRAAPAVGSQLPDLTVYDAAGKPFPLGQLKGDYTVLVFGCMT